MLLVPLDQARKIPGVGQAQLPQVWKPFLIQRPLDEVPLQDSMMLWFKLQGGRGDAPTTLDTHLLHPLAHLLVKMGGLSSRRAQHRQAYPRLGMGRGPGTKSLSPSSSSGVGSV